MDNIQWFWAGFTVCAIIWLIYDLYFKTLDKKQVVIAKPVQRRGGEKSSHPFLNKEVRD